MVVPDNRRSKIEDRKLLIGLVGGIGSGKSLVADELVKRGGYLISGDRIGHEALTQADIKERAIQRWGQSIVDPARKIDRRRLGKIVFADVAERKALEALVHPWIERGIAEEMAKGSADPNVRFLVLDAAIMLEAGWSGRCDRVVFVHAPRKTRLERLATQRTLSAEEVEARENAQWPLAEKEKRADFVLDNSGTLEQIGPQVDELLARWGLGPKKE